MTQTIADTPISEEAWQSARPGHRLKDAYEREWIIMENRGARDGGWGLMLQLPTDELPEEFIMTSQLGGRHIVDADEWAIMMEFNNPGAEILTT